MGRSVNKDKGSMVAALSHLRPWFLAVLSVGACQKYEPIASQSPYTHHKIHLPVFHFGAQQEIYTPSHTFHSQTFQLPNSLSPYVRIDVHCTRFAETPNPLSWELPSFRVKRRY